MSGGDSSVKTPLGMALISALVGERMDYRAHDIAVHLDRIGASAKVYDGKRAVFTAHGMTEADAFNRAKAWIDEQDESLSEYDLHTG